MYAVALVIYQLSIFGIAVQLPKPSDLFLTFLLGIQFLAHLRIKMELFRLVASLNLNLVKRCQYLV